MGASFTTALLGIKLLQDEVDTIKNRHLLYLVVNRIFVTSLWTNYNSSRNPIICFSTESICSSIFLGAMAKKRALIPIDEYHGNGKGEFSLIF
ncbi:hypothetical protein PanWU01x14_244460 [Parasponia andersonii]|uniref:Uncharacterized protein n=1 Tax=Parasponia andersonii TaxID=3476 RepID=A0A2P5BFC2_PARAD|nr:hypothetical protein PanWU01x14_244460 [Parasponia andersonii]